MPGIKSLESYNGKAYIDGAFVDSSSSTYKVVLNPSNGDVLGKVPNCTYEETNRAIAAANKAQKIWEKVSPMARAKVCRKMAALMEKHQNDLARMLTLEAGKPFKEALGENMFSCMWFDWYAGECERITGEIAPQHRPGVRPFVHKKPIGVVAVITPWNHPSAMVTRSVAGALAAGCAVVLKPSEFTPFTALALADLLEQAGFPKGLYNVVTGAPEPIGQAIADSSVVRKLCFTGSTRTGKILMEQSVKTVKHVAMELGGNAPFIVFEDANLDLAAQGLIVAKFRGAGQTCISPNRVLVHEKVHDEFVAKLVAAMKKSLITGDGLKDGVTMGPVIHKAAASRILASIEDAKSRGAAVATGGGRPEGLTAQQAANGCFVAPTVLVNCSQTMGLACNEVFGPVLPVMKFSSEDEVIALANDTNAGLAGYFYTQDAERMDRVAQQLQYGMIAVNEGMLSSPYTPFGGVKESGLGRDGGREHGLNEFLQVVLHLYGKSKL